MKNIFLLFIIITTSVVTAQVGIGINTPNSNTILDVKSEGKGVIFTKNATDYTSFPLYNSSQFDLFNDDESLEGALIFNNQDKQYYKYDGRAWNPAKQVTAAQNPLASRMRSTGSASILCAQFTLVNLCLGSDAVPVGSQAENENEVLIDNLEIHNTETVIQESGLYVVVASMGFSGGQLTCGFGQVRYQSNIEVQYPGNNNWIAVSTMSNYSGSFIIDLQGEKNSSASLSMYLPAGAKLRMKPTMKNPSITCGGLGLYSSSSNHILTYLGVELIHKY